MMIKPRLSDFDLVEGAIDVMYFPTSPSRKPVSSEENEEHMSETPIEQQKTRQLQHVIPKGHHQTWLDHLIPILPSSSPGDTPEQTQHHTTVQDGTPRPPSDSDIDSLFEDSPEQAANDTSVDLPKEMPQSTWHSWNQTKDLPEPGADKIRATNRECDIQYVLSDRQNPVGEQENHHRIEEPWHGRLYHNLQVPEENEYQFTSNSSKNDIDWPSQQTHHSPSTTFPAPSRHPSLIPLRHGSGDSQKSLQMEISPEDQSIPFYDNVCSSKPDCRTSSTIDMECAASNLEPLRSSSIDYWGSVLTSPVHIAGDHSPHSIFPHRAITARNTNMQPSLEVDECYHLPRIQENYISSNDCSDEPGKHQPLECIANQGQSYQKDYRLFDIRPALPVLVSSSDTLCRGNITLNSRREFDVSNIKSESAISHERNQMPLDNQCPTESYMTTVYLSPVRCTDPSSVFDASIQPSVEVEPSCSPQACARESTPAYEDRSPSPSPISKTDEAIHSSATDMEMVDAPSTPPRSHREHSVPSANSCSNLMPPPPSPIRSQPHSPHNRTWETASPSQLRSPAIVRVVQQSQLPHGQTSYSFMLHRSPSPTPDTYSSPVPSYGFSNLSSVTKALPSPEHPTTSSQSNTVRNAVNTNTGIPAPPPIPCDPPPIKQAKRSARRKSGIQDPGVKVMKARSITLSAARSGGGHQPPVAVNGVGKRCVTGGQRQRVVTQKFVESLIEGAERDSPGLRRSARLKEKKP